MAILCLLLVVYRVFYAPSVFDDDNVFFGGFLPLVAAPVRITDEQNRVFFHDRTQQCALIVEGARVRRAHGYAEIRFVEANEFFRYVPRNSTIAYLQHGSSEILFWEADAEAIERLRMTDLSKIYSGDFCWKREVKKQTGIDFATTVPSFTVKSIPYDRGMR